MSPDFREILTKSGPPAHVTPVPEAVREAYRGRVPDGLLDFWAEIGWCSLEDGYYWVCDPRQFDGLLADVFRGDPEFDPADFTIFQYDSFGKLYGWRNDTHLISLSLAGYKANFSAQSMDRRPETAERWSDDRLRAAFARSREEFCFAYGGALDANDPFSAIISHDARQAQPWSRVDVQRNIVSIVEPDGSFVSLSDEGDVYRLRESGGPIREKIPGAGRRAGVQDGERVKVRIVPRGSRHASARRLDRQLRSGDCPDPRMGRRQRQRQSS